MANTAIVGYQLKQISSNTIIQSWGGTWNQVPSIPSVLRITDLELDVCAPALDTVYGDDYMLVAWYMDEPAESIPDSISDRQFFQQANISGFITQTEALAAVKTGEIPNTMYTIVQSLPANTQFDAEMLLSGATIFYRNHPLVEIFGDYFGMTSENVDSFFVSAGKL